MKKDKAQNETKPLTAVEMQRGVILTFELLQAHCKHSCLEKNWCSNKDADDYKRGNGFTRCLEEICPVLKKAR